MDRTRTDQAGGGMECGAGRGARWAMALLASLAVVAIAVLMVLLTGGPDEPEPGGTGGPQPGAGEPSASGTGGTFDLRAGATPGEPPAVPYLERDRLVRPDGTTTRLPRAYDQFALLGDRIVATYDDHGDRVLDVLDASGRRVDSSPVEANFAIDAGGDVVAWATPRGVLETLWAGGSHTWGDQGGPVTVSAVVSDGSCGADDASCRVFVNLGDGRPPRVTGPGGAVESVAARALRVADAHADGRVAVQVSSTDTGSCSGVLEDGASLWETCEHSLLRLSPAGDLVLGTHAYLDGIGLNSLSILDAGSGDVLATYTIRGGFIAQQTWEDDAHVLAVVSGPHGWEMLRLGLDGTRERVAGPVEPTPDPTFKQLTLPGNV